MSDEKVEEGPATPAIQAILDQCKDELADRVGSMDVPLVAQKYRRTIQPNGDSTYSIRATHGSGKLLLEFAKPANGPPQFIAHAFICEMYGPAKTEDKPAEN